MKISIITVTKNNKAGLLRAIECVSNQTYKNIEHIVVDGGSTDGTKEVMYDGRWMTDNVKFFSDPDNGIYDAINKGIRLATGDVIGLLHSDDLYAEPEVLEKIAEAFNHSNCDSVYGDLVYVSKVKSSKSKVQSQKSNDKNKLENNHSISYSVIRCWKTQKKEFTTDSQRHKALQKGWMPPHPTLFVKKEVFDKFGLYRTDMKISADYEMILRLLWSKNISTYYINKILVWMSIGGASNKNLRNILQKSKEDYLAMKLNGINFPMVTLLYKNFRKLPQFLARDL